MEEQVSVVHPPLLQKLEHICRVLSPIFVPHEERERLQQAACKHVIHTWNYYHKSDQIFTEHEYERYAERKGWPYNF